MFHAANFFQKVLGQNGNVRLLQPSCGEYIYHLTRSHDGARHQLLDRLIKINLITFANFRFLKRRLHSLKKSNVITKRNRIGSCCTQRKRPRNFRGHSYKSLLAVLRLHNVFMCRRKNRQPLGTTRGRPRRPIESVQHGTRNFALLYKNLDRLIGGLIRAALAAALCIGRKRLLQLIRKPEIVNNQTTGLVLEYTIHSCDGLHQTMSAHRFVGVHGVQTWRIKARQPHVTHNHYRERIF